MENPNPVLQQIITRSAEQLRRTYRGHAEALRVLADRLDATSDGMTEPAGIPELRPALIAFAAAMEAKLRLNDHKAHWSTLSPAEAIRLLLQEVAELIEVLLRPYATAEEVLGEASDVGNCAMFIGDNAPLWCSRKDALQGTLTAQEYLAALNDAELAKAEDDTTPAEMLAMMEPPPVPEDVDDHAAALEAAGAATLTTSVPPVIHPYKKCAGCSCRTDSETNCAPNTCLGPYWSGATRLKFAVDRCQACVKRGDCLLADSDGSDCFVGVGTGGSAE